MLYVKEVYLSVWIVVVVCILTIAFPTLKCRHTNFAKAICAADYFINICDSIVSTTHNYG